MHTYNLRQMATRYGWNLKEIDAVFTKLSFMQQYAVWMAGGALRRAILGVPVAGEADFDFFFRNESTFKTCCEEIENMGAKKLRASDLNVTYEIPITLDDKDVTVLIQFITATYYNNPEDILSSFDFTLCQFAIGFARDILYCGETSLYDVANKHIIVNRIDYPVASVRRMIKYTKQGFYACPGSILTFLEGVQSIQGELMRGQPSSLD